MRRFSGTSSPFSGSLGERQILTKKTLDIISNKMSDNNNNNSNNNINNNNKDSNNNINSNNSSNNNINSGSNNNLNNNNNANNNNNNNTNSNSLLWFSNNVELFTFEGVDGILLQGYHIPSIFAKHLGKE